MPERTRTKRLLRACLAIALLVALCIVGYRRGYRNGYEVQRQQPNFTTVFIRTYPVGDLITPTAESSDAWGPSKVAAFDSLIDLIVSTIEHESWMENGTGEGEIQPFPVNLSLVISQTQRVHEQVSDLLQQLRRLQVDVAAKELIPYLQSCAAYGKDASHAFRKLPSGAKGTAAANKLFDRAVENLAALWGAPRFNGEQRAEDFPTWSQADRVAIWPRGSGKAYLAAEDDPAAGRVLTAGWRQTEPALNATTEK